MQEDVKQWNTLGRFKTAFSSGDHVDGLKGYQETVRTALEEMEVGKESLLVPPFTHYHATSFLLA